jgi:AraC-like DNA-binding protein
MPEVLEATGRESVERLLSRSYQPMRIKEYGQRGGLRMTRASLGQSARLDHNVFTRMSFDITQGAPLGVLAVGYLRDGRAAVRSGGGERSYGPGDVFLAPRPGHSYTASAADPEIEVTVLALDLLGQVAGTAPGRAAQPVRFTGYDPVSPLAAQTWRHTSAYVRGAVLADLGAAAQPLVVSSMARVLAAVALTVFPSNAVTEPTSEDRRDSRPATVRRAMAFIDEHAHQDITVADIAAAAHVTVRAVQLAFRRHRDTTPMEYLRRVRLEAARRDLAAADPAQTTVAAIAYRWGFPSSSRFAARYRRAYGDTPSRTLRQVS